MIPTQSNATDETISSYNSSAVEIASARGVKIPDEFVCPITLEVMEHPMMTRFGLHYERAAIVDWIQQGNDTCPLTRKPLSFRDIINDRLLKDRIDYWLDEHDIPRKSADDDINYCPVLSISNMELLRKQGSEATVRQRRFFPVFRRRNRNEVMQIEINEEALASSFSEMVNSIMHSRRS